jgi:arachidonate 15-lipoxygenase
MVSGDTELQAWVAEMIAPRPQGGQLKGLGEDGKIETVGYLVDVVTHIIFTASVQHAAVNFPQFNMMSYAPKMPLSLYAPAPTSRDVTDRDYLAALPPLNLAYGQAALGYLLGSVRYTRLGQYERPRPRSISGALGRVIADLKGRPPGYFADPRVKGPLIAFQGRLADIEEKIGASHRRFGYDYLMPSNIPQSTNI